MLRDARQCWGLVHRCEAFKSNHQLQNRHMTDALFDKPILNSSYPYPASHWELDAQSQPTQQVVEKRMRELQPHDSDRSYATRVRHHLVGLRPISSADFGSFSIHVPLDIYRKPSFSIHVILGPHKNGCIPISDGSRITLAAERAYWQLANPGETLNAI